MLFAENKFVRRQLLSLALLAGLTAPATSDETDKQSSQPQQVVLDATPTPIPAGLNGFNGMLVGRLAAKDVEKGTFVVQVDAVSRVWRNSEAKDPKSIVGKTVEVAGVFGRFLDVLVVTRAGETLEFECKHDGDRLVFPGELLRKVAAYDAADYPVLPEEFRGFRGSVTATILKKDAETFELIIKVEQIKDTWDGNKAENPKSIEGKPMMLAGFWNRKDDYHRIKVGQKIEVGMQHIAIRSDHLSVAEFIRNVETDAGAPSTGRDGRANGHGFRGILVGRLVSKDVERGTLSITVDAVPRIWENIELPNPKSLMGTQVSVVGVTGAMSDALVVTRTGETIEVAALFDGDKQLRVGEVLRKVAPVKPGDYPEVPAGFRGFRGLVTAKVIRSDPQLMELIVEITEIKTTLSGNHAEKPESIVGRRALLGGFWNRKDVFHDLKAGDTITCGIHHRQPESDLLNVIESVEKIKK